MVKVICHKAHHHCRRMVQCYSTVMATCPSIRAHWRHLANTIELMHPSAHSSPQSKRWPFLHSLRQKVPIYYNGRLLPREPPAAHCLVVVVAHSIAFRVVSICWQGDDTFPWNLASKWPALSCQWYPIGDVRTHNSRTDSRRIFKLGGGVDHVTRHVWPLTKVKRSKVKVTRSRNVSAAIKL